MTQELQALVQCYLSGQVSERQWEAHCQERPQLREMLAQQRPAAAAQKAAPSDEEIDAILAEIGYCMKTDGFTKEMSSRELFTKFAALMLARHCVQPAQQGSEGMLQRAYREAGLPGAQPAASACVGCEGKPAPENNPCAVCSKSAASAPVAAQAQPKRRPYNASGSLSEYGVFPECDAAQASDETRALEDMLDDARAEIEALRVALGVPVEPHQSLHERMIEAAQASGQDDSCLRERITELLDTNRRQQVQIKTLEARIHRQAQDAEDAARYRLIRSKVSASNATGRESWSFHYDRLPRPLKNPLRGSVAEHFDHAIDAARAAGGEHDGH